MGTIILSAIGGVILTIIVMHKLSTASGNAQRRQYGFAYFRYDKLDFAHKYHGDFLYVCERVPYLDDKVKKLPEELFSD